MPYCDSKACNSCAAKADWRWIFGLGFWQDVADEPAAWSLLPHNISDLPMLMLRDEPPFAHCPLSGTALGQACLRRDTLVNAVPALLIQRISDG